MWQTPLRPATSHNNARRQKASSERMRKHGRIASRAKNPRSEEYTRLNGSRAASASRKTRDPCQALRSATTSDIVKDAVHMVQTHSSTPQNVPRRLPFGSKAALRAARTPAKLRSGRRRGAFRAPLGRRSDPCEAGSSPTAFSTESDDALRARLGGCVRARACRHKWWHRPSNGRKLWSILPPGVCLEPSPCVSSRRSCA